MKPALFSFILSVVLLFGCADSSISPIKSDTKPYQLIKLPPKSGLSVETIFSKTKTINGDDGGNIKIKESYVAADGHTVKIDVKLKVKKHSYSGDVEITMTVDDVYAAVTFTPHMVFDKPVELKMKFEGIDLAQLNLTTGEYDFIYIDDNGNTETVEYNGIEVNEEHGKIKLNKGKLHHFSRYAFSR